MKQIKRLIRATLPKQLTDRLRARYRSVKLTRANRLDRLRYARQSAILHGGRSRTHKRAALTFDYHKLEKGLALPNPRPGFAKPVAAGLVRDLNAYEAEFGADDMSQIVGTVLEEYARTNAAHGAKMEEVERFLATRPTACATVEAGSVTLRHDELFPVDPDTARRFLMSRRSARQFTGAPVERSEIEAAIAMAQRAPSVCNRQSGRVFCTNDPEKMARVLAHQNGNRGFGHTLGAVLIVASEVRSFRDVGERNQPFVDGGIFAMAVAFALHARGLGACMLNWSVEPAVDAALRREFAIPDSCVVITMIGCGHVGETLRVAASPRDPLQEVLQWL